MNNSTHLVQVPLAEPSIDQLAASLLAAKATLRDHQKAVADAEAALIARVGAKDEGSFTVKSERYKVTTTQPITRKADPYIAKQLINEMPRDIYDGLFEWRPNLSAKVYKDLEKYQPELFAKVSKAVTSKAGKIAVKVEDIV